MKADQHSHTTAPSWWSRWFVGPVRRQLMQGVSPDCLGWSAAAGVTLGIFPIMGSTTILCAAAAWILRLNQPVTQLCKSAVYPLHLALILVFIRLGQRLFGVPLLTLSIPELMARFQQSPARFGRDFGMAALQGITAWLLVGPPLAVGIKWAITPLMRRAAVRLEYGKEVLP